MRLGFSTYKDTQMPVLRKKKPNVLLWGFIAGLAFFWFGVYCFWIGMKYAYYGEFLPKKTLTELLAFLISVTVPTVTMMIALAKLRQSGP